jgi:hypothetical protein
MHITKKLFVWDRRGGWSAALTAPLAHSCMSRANNAFEVSEEFGPAFGTPGDQRLFTRKLSAFDPPLRAALRAQYIGFEPVSAAVS